MSEYQIIHNKKIVGGVILIDEQIKPEDYKIIPEQKNYSLEKMVGDQPPKPSPTIKEDFMKVLKMYEALGYITILKETELQEFIEKNGENHMKKDTRDLIKKTLHDTIEIMMKQIETTKNNMLVAEKQVADGSLSKEHLLGFAERVSHLVIGANYLSGVNDGLQLTLKTEKELQDFISKLKVEEKETIKPNYVN